MRPPARGRKLLAGARARAEWYGALVEATNRLTWAGRGGTDAQSSGSAGADRFHGPWRVRGAVVRDKRAGRATADADAQRRRPGLKFHDRRVGLSSILHVARVLVRGAVRHRRHEQERKLQRPADGAQGIQWST